MALGLVLMLGLVGGGRWWTRPGEGWACGRGAPVDCEAPLNVFRVPGAPARSSWQLAFNTFDVTPDRDVVAAGFVRPRGDGQEPAARLLIHDLTASLQPEPVTTAPDGEPFTYVEGAGWSPDGTRLVAYIRTARTDHLVVLDRAARYVGDVPLPGHDVSCSWRVGLSADGTTVRCGDGLWDLASGAPLASAPGEVATAWGDQLGGNILLADDGTTIRSFGADLTVDPGGPVALPYGADGFRLALDPASATLTVVERTLARPVWREPRRSRAEGRITWVAVASRSVTTSVAVEGHPFDIDPDLADGWIALLTTDGGVLFLRPPV